MVHDDDLTKETCPQCRPGLWASTKPGSRRRMTVPGWHMQLASSAPSESIASVSIRLEHGMLGVDASTRRMDLVLISSASKGLALWSKLERTDRKVHQIRRRTHSVYTSYIPIHIHLFGKP